jgi:hypothetical protein
VSFARIYFREGGGTINASGFYGAANGTTHDPWVIAPLISSCNLTTGCVGAPRDIIYTNRWTGPFSIGVLDLPIKWQYAVAESAPFGEVMFMTGPHHQEADIVGATTIRKAGSGDFRSAVNDATSGDGCAVGNL